MVCLQNLKQSGVVRHRAQMVREGERDREIWLKLDRQAGLALSGSIHSLLPLAFLLRGSWAPPLPRMGAVCLLS